MAKCKCGRELIKSPMNPAVRICDGCFKQKVNCTCKELPRVQKLNAGNLEP